jgi:hypothetical protein
MRGMRGSEVLSHGCNSRFSLGMTDRKASAAADPSLLHPTDEDLSAGTPFAQDDKQILGVVVSHPSRKNKGAARMGHPDWANYWAVEDR